MVLQRKTCNSLATDTFRRLRRLPKTITKSARSKNESPADGKLILLLLYYAFVARSQINGDVDGSKS